MLDWGIAATLAAMGTVPAAVPAPNWCNFYFGEEVLPKSVLNIGLLFTPNFEALQELAPDLIIIPPALMTIKGELQKTGPVAEVDIFHPGRGALELAVTGTRRLGEMVGIRDQADQLVLATEQRMDATRRKLGKFNGRPAVIASPIDSRHVSLFGSGSLYGDVLVALGQANAVDFGDTREFDIVGVETLQHYKDCNVFLMDTPAAPGTAEKLSTSRLWKSLDFVKQGRLHRIPPILGSGGLPAAIRFARSLDGAIT